MTKRTTRYVCFEYEILNESFSVNLDVDEREEPSSGLTIPDDWPEDAEHRTLDEF